jgi:NAD+ kinase
MIQILYSIVIMDEKLKILAQQIVTKTQRKLIRCMNTDFYKMSKTVDIGADGTPTKYIDKIAEDVAVKEISKSQIPVNLLSEEIGFIDNNSEYVIVLDPVDGTRNAIRGIPFFSISVAVGKKNLSDVEYGIVRNVGTNDTFIAEKNHGAYLNKKQIVVPDFPASELLISVTMGKNLDNLTLNIAKKNVIRSLGAASLEMCMVASGGLDAYIVGKEFMRVTDIAASTLILREAGGFVFDKYGKDLEMSLNLDERTSIVASGNHDFIKKLLGKSKDLK